MISIFIMPVRERIHFISSFQQFCSKWGLNGIYIELYIHNYITTYIHLLVKTYLKNQDETHLKKIVKLLSFYILQYNVIALKCCPIKLCTSCKNRQMFVCRTLLFGSRHVCDLFFPKFSFVLAIRCLVFENTKDYVWNMHPFVKTLRLDDFLSVTANLCFLLLFHRCHWNTKIPWYSRNCFIYIHQFFVGKWNIITIQCNTDLYIW